MQSWCGLVHRLSINHSPLTARTNSRIRSASFRPGDASTPLATVLAYLPELTVSDLKELAAPGIVPENLRKYLQAEVQRRLRASEKKAARTAPAKDSPSSNN